MESKSSNFLELRKASVTKLVKSKSKSNSTKTTELKMKSGMKIKILEPVFNNNFFQCYI